MSQEAVGGAARAHLAERFGSAGIGPRVLGLIVSTAVMAAAGELGSVSDVVVSVAVAVFIYWIAEAYADAFATHLSNPNEFWGALRHEMRQRWPMVEAASGPVIAMVLAVAVGAGDSVAINIGLAVGTALLFCYAWVAAARGGLGGWTRVGAAFAIASLGVAMIALKIYMHSPRGH